MKKSENTEGRKREIQNKLIPIIFLLVIIALWQMLVAQGLIPEYVLPSPGRIGKTLIEIFPEIWRHMVTTLREAGIGFGIAIVFSIALAMMMDNVSIIRRALYPLILVSQTVPIIALAPLFVIWFGFGMLPKIIVVVLVCFFPIVVSLLDGLESIDRDMINLLRSMGASRLSIFKIVKFPSAMVSFFSGLRIAATYSIMGAVIGEWLGGSDGLGVYMIRVKHSYALDKFFAVIIVIVALSMLLFKVIELLQRIVMPWKREK